MTTLAIDTHVHIYPGYDLGRIAAAVQKNIGGVPAGDQLAVLLLAERHDCRFFRALQQGHCAPAAGLQIKSIGPASIRCAAADGAELVFAAGRQIVSAERIEVLAHLADPEIEDGLPIDQLLEQIRRSNAFPVLPWSPGKWWSERGRVIERLIAAHTPQQLGFSDSALRPYGWPQPALLTRAEKKGFAIFAGSDPLPLIGEEDRAGMYFCSAGSFSISPEGRPDDFHHLLEGELRRILAGSGGAAVVRCGRRLTPAGLLKRLLLLKRRG